MEPSGKTEIVEAPVKEINQDGVQIPVNKEKLDTKQVFEILEGLAEGMSKISSELGAIRKMMESDRPCFLNGSAQYEG